nr:hypothetical protein B0A51_07657 [Rachicladosporium sp. CCFEE 5018]
MPSSSLLHQTLIASVATATPAPPPRPRPRALRPEVPDIDSDRSSSSDSASSASSTASVVTVRPSSREAAAGPSSWTQYFERELWLEHDLENGVKAVYHVYVTPPKDVRKGPLFVCHHGAGASGLSFAVLAREIRGLMLGAGVLALEARGHGSSVTGSDGNEVANYSLETLTMDALNMIMATSKALDWPGLPPLLLIGHSLGGAIMTTLATTHWRALGAALVGYAVLDVVEGSALEALSHMKTYLSSRPRSFASAAEAVDWHLRSRTVRSRESAEASVPSLLVPSLPNSGSYTWRTDLSTTSSAWEGWFQGMSSKFLTGRGAKLLILAGTDRLDKELMIGQMQGKFQLVVLPEAGHFVHEDVPAKVAGLLVEFWKRNDRSAMVLPPKRDKRNKWNYRARIPVVNARLISQQFKSEYDEMSHVHHLLRMEDHPQVSMDEPDSVSIPQWFKKSVDFEITFLVTWYSDTYESEDYYDLDEGMSLLERILGEFDDLEKLRITVFFVKRTGASTVWAHIQSKILCLSELRCTRQIQVVCVVPGRLGSEGGSNNGSSDGENSDSEDPDGDTDDSESEVDADVEELSQNDTPDCGYPDDNTWDFVYQGDQPRRRPITKVVATWTEQGLILDEEEVKALRALDRQP